MSAANILIVDDEEGIRFFLSETIAKEGYRYKTASNGEEAFRLLERERFDLVILDYNMPGLNGIQTFTKIKETHPEIVGILITAYGNKKLAIEAMRVGLFDYFTKPFDIEEIRIVMRRAAERSRLQKEVKTLRSNLEERAPNILGTSQAIKDVLERVNKVAASNVAVLILGESGTGKELIAQALHFGSPRQHEPFIKVNCTAIPHDLLEAEFFGFEKGAFTGAVKRKIGKFEQAHEGTLFLDEIGDMPLTTQSKILRVIQENELERVGGETSIKVDIRLITATNKDLKKAVKEGEFREDLFYRLNVVSIKIPPLRERKQDIPVLANHFLELYNRKFRKDIETISDGGMELLMNYAWPGNIRELENVIQRGIILAYENSLGRKQLLEVYPSLGDGSPEPLSGPALQDKMETLVGATEKRLILEALREENWKRQETADRLGISRKSLHNKMKKYGLIE
ncbi:MAG: sigma-54-dependent transcriptional regulator [Nitrospinales bacterium]